MNNEGNKKRIKDDEFGMFLEYDFFDRLETTLRELPIGERIVMLESLGFDIKVKSIVEKYISKEGYTMDPTGNLYIQEDTIRHIFALEENRISEDFDIDISKITDANQLKKIITEPEYKESVSKFGLEATIERYDLIPEERAEKEEIRLEDIVNAFLGDIDYKDIEAFNKFLDAYETTAGLRQLLKDNKELNMTEVEIDNFIDQIEQKTIETNINSKETTQSLRCLYRLREAEKYRQENGELSYRTEVEDTLRELNLVLDKSQYKEEITDENGNIDINKAVAFLNNWEKTRNQTKLSEYLSKAQNVKMSDLKLINLPKMLVLFAQAAQGDDETNKKIALSLAKEILKSKKVDILDKSRKNIDLNKVSEVYKSICGEDADIQQEIRDSEWNEITANDKLDRIDNSIDNSLGIFNRSRDEIEADREEYNKLLEKTNQNKMKYVEAIIEGNNLSPEEVVTLFYEFRKKELTPEGKELPQMTGKQLVGAREHGCAKIIYDYMITHPEEFNRYLNKNGNLLGSKINEYVSNHQFSEQETEKINKYFGRIETELTTLEERKNQALDLRKDLDERLDALVGMSKDEISEEDKINIFARAIILENSGALTRHMKRHLIRIDSERYKATFSESQLENQYVNFQNAVMEKISSLGKGLTALPMKFLETNIKKEGETQDSANKRNGFFSKLFEKNKTKMLPEGKKESKDNQVDKAKSTNQQSFDMNQKYEINHPKAIEETEAARIAKENEKGTKDVAEVSLND